MLYENTIFYQTNNKFNKKILVKCRYVKSKQKKIVQ